MSLSTATLLLLLESPWLKLKMGRKRRRYWIQDTNIDRVKYGEFHTLYHDLRNDEERFRRYFQMSVCAFDYILEAVRETITKQNSNFRSSISPEERLMLTLRFLSSGMSCGAVADFFRIEFSTVHQIIVDVCDAIWCNLVATHMPEPDEAILLNSAEGYLQKWNFPNCVASIDGKHIRVKCPANSGSQNLIVLLGLADANYRFLSIEVVPYGRQLNGELFTKSNLNHRLKANDFKMPQDKQLPQTNIQLPFVILGDDNYPLTPWMMRPYPKNKLDEPKSVFNFHLSRARTVVESAFGILATKWKVLDAQIEETPENVNKIIKCVCILHNVIIDRDGVDESLLESENVVNQRILNTEVLSSRANNRHSQEAGIIRQDFTDYFNNNRNLQ